MYVDTNIPTYPPTHKPTTNKHDSADSGPLWDGDRVRIAPTHPSGSNSKQLLCTFAPATTAGYPYDHASAPTSGSSSNKKPFKPRTYILQLALPASWAHGPVRGAERVTPQQQQPEQELGRAERPLVRAVGGWRDLVAGVDGEEEDGVGVGRRDGWAWDAEEQGTLWLRVSESGAGEAVRVVLSFGG